MDSVLRWLHTVSHQFQETNIHNFLDGFQEPDSISHTFLNCRWSIQFYSEVIKWFNKENDTTFSPSPVEILFGKKSSNCSQGSFKLLRKFNYTLLFAKYYLYTQNLIKKEINTKEYIRKLTFKYQIEKLF